MSALIGKPSLVRAAVLTLLILTAAAAFTQAVRLPGATPVGAGSSTQSVTLTLPKGGTLASIKVLTQGSPALDFAAAPAGSTCSPGTTYLPGQQCSVAISFTPTAPGERRGAIVLLDAANSPLATRLLVAQASGGVAAFIPGTIATVAGNEAWIYGGDGNLATASSIFLPFGLAVDGAGNLFIADFSNNRIRRVDAATGIISTIAGTGVIGATGDGGPAIAATVSSPSSVALDPAGNLYFADSGNNLVRRIDAFTGILTTVAGAPNTHGYSGDLGPATAATLNTPNGIAFDALGNLYIADTGNHVIRQITPAGTISTIAGRGIPSFSGDGGPAVSAGLDSPWSVTPTPTGGLYIADQNNNRIRLITPDGFISTIIGTGVGAFSGDNGPATLAALNVPASVALDVAGNLYIADSGNNRIRKISSKTGIVTTIAGNSGESISGDMGPADQAGLYGPYTLALDGQGSLLIADVFHNRIRKVSANAATLPFPPMRVGRLALPLFQTLENDGNAPLNLATFVPTSQSQLDPNATTCAAGIALNPLDQCILSLQFAPQTTGNPVLGFFTTNSDAANSPSIVTLTGQVLNVDPSAVTVTSSANPSPTGSPVTYSVRVSSGGATPTGQVTLLDGTTALATAQLAAGLAAFTTSTLASGQHTITVAYAGDSSNSSSVSVPLLQLVKDVQAATSTLLASSATPTIAGAPLILSASVGVVTPGAGTGTITGTVAFEEGPVTLGTADLVNGTANLTITTLAAASHSIVAVYSGNSNYAQSTSAPFHQVVQTATTKLALTTSASPSYAGASLTLTATILSNGGVPTGPITFIDSTAASLGTANLNAQGIATLVVPGSAWTPGLHTLTATYAGDASNQGSTSAPVAQSIILASTAATLTSSLTPSPLGGSITLTATLTSSGGIPTGSVQILDGSTSLGLANLNPVGVATLTTSSLTLGLHALSVTYAGDSYDGPVTSKPLSESIIPTTDAITLSPSNNPAIVATPVLFTVAVTGTGAIPTGTVTLTEGATTLASAPIDSKGNATFTLATLDIATHTLTAVYSGDTTHAAATSLPVAERIIQSSSLTVSAPAHTIAGTPMTIAATLTGVSGKPTTGPITLAEGSTPLATLTPDATGHAAWTTSTLAVGPHTLTAAYAGDTLSAATTATTTAFSVEIAGTSTTLASSLNPIGSGSPLTLTAQVTGTGGMPTGSVTFRDAGNILATINLTGNSAALTLSTLAPGIHQLSASYTGDPFDSPSTSSALAQQVAQQTLVSLTSSANPSLLSDNITLTLTAGNGSATPPTGSLVLTDSGHPLATLPLGNGSATYTFAAPAVGSHTLVATYAGDAGNGPATSQPLVQVVNLRPSALTFTPSSTGLAAGEKLVLISVVAGNGPNPPSGSVTFTAGTQTLGNAPITAGGVATLTLTPPAGTYSATATYTGDSLYAPSTSAAITIAVGPPIAFTLTPTPPSLTLKSGDHTTFTLAIATNPIFTDTLAFGCAGLPAYATCTFSQNQIPVSSGNSQTITVTLDTGNPLGAGANARLDPPAVTPRSLPPHNPATFCIFPAMIFLALFHPRKASPRAQSSGSTTRPSPFLPLGTPLPRRLLCFSLLALSLLGTLTGCGTTFTQRATPAGSYTFQVVGTGNKTTATQTVTLQLQVTQ